MRNAFGSLVLALGLTFASVTPATAQSGGGYGDAGCGLGSIIFGSTPGFVQILAATTNGFLGTQTFGITTGTSNCGNAVRNQVGAKAFIQTNRQALAKDIAKGSGETIASLSTLAGCKDASLVGARLQSSYLSIFPTAQVSDVEVSDTVVELLSADPVLACGNLS